MAIEIKELIVKFKVEGGRKVTQFSERGNFSSDKTVKQIVEQCTEQVLRHINKLNER